MKTVRPIQYPQRSERNFANEAPFVTPYAATPDSRGFFESILGFEGMAGKWFRLPASVQRYYFGNVPFGKRAIKVSDMGEVTIFKSQAFGQDWDTWTVTFDHSARAWKNSDGETLSCVLPCNL